MAVSEARDSAEDWLLPAAARPRSFAELEARVELAMTVAQASEAAIAEVGAAAIEAAEQARQAADLAARAATGAQAAAADAEAARAEAMRAAATAPPQPQAEPAPAAASATTATSGEEWLIRFTHRAERLSARLVKLQHC